MGNFMSQSRLFFDSVAPEPIQPPPLPSHVRVSDPFLMLVRVQPKSLPPMPEIEIEEPVEAPPPESILIDDADVVRVESMLDTAWAALDEETSQANRRPTEPPPLPSLTEGLARDIDPAQIDAVGGTVGVYIPMRKLGEFRGEETYLAARPHASQATRPVILERLVGRPGISWTKRKARFLAEARIGMRLRHPHLASMIDAGDHGHGPFRVRELVNGPSLRELAGITGVMRPAMVAAIGWQIAQALGYVHAKSDRSGRPLHLVHGALSPSTVFFGRDGQAKLSPVSVTHLGDEPLHATNGGREGRFACASPEQREGLPYDLRSDIYALGIILAELATGQPLPEAEEAQASLGLELTRRCAALGNVPPQLTALLLSMTASVPDSRPDRADDVVLSLERIMESAGEWPNLSDEIARALPLVEPIIPEVTQ
jgi:serine/threonine protein kinase